MLYRVLSLSFLLSTILSAGDTPQSHTVEMVNKNPSNPPQMPQVDFKHPHTNGGGGNASSGVGSSTGGSALNLVKDLLAPSAKELERDREIEALNKQLSRAMTKSSIKQLGGNMDAYTNPGSYDAYGFPVNQNLNVPVINDPLSVGPVTIGAPIPAPAVVATPAVIPAPVVVAQAPTVLKTVQMPSFIKTTSLAGAIQKNAPISTSQQIGDGFLDLDNSKKMAETADKFVVSVATPSPFQGSSGTSDNASGGSNGPGGIQAIAATGALLTQVVTAPTAPTAVAGGGAVATTGWGATLGGYAIVAAPVVLAGLVGAGAGLGLAMLHDGIFNPGIGWFPSTQQRAAYHANRAAQNAAKKASANAPSSNSSGGAPSPKKPEEPKERKFNQVQRTEAMNRIKENYRYDNQTKTYILKDNGKPIMNSMTGKPVKIVYWDKQHGDIEAWRGLYRGDHLGSLDPETFQMYKGPDLKRTIL